MQQYIDLDSFTAVGAGETANLVLPVGARYDEIHLESNQATSIEWVRLTLNAEEVFKLTRAELSMLNSYEGVTQSTGFITIPLALENAVMLESKVLTGLETGMGDNVVLEVKFADDAVSPTLKAFANVSGHAGYRAVVRRFMPYTIPVTANGEVDFTSLVKTGRILRMYFESDKVAKLEIKKDMRVVYELSKERNDMLLKRAGKNLISGYFVFDPTKRNYPVAEAMATADAQNLNFKLTIDGLGAGESGNVRVLVEQLEPMSPRDWRGK